MTSRSLMAARAFDTALAGGAATLLDSDGAESALPVRRWHGPADADDAWLLHEVVRQSLAAGPGKCPERRRLRRVRH